MRPLVLGALVLMVSLLFLNVWQSYRYEESLRVMEAMEYQQEEWVDKNRKVLAAESLLETPSRLDSLAEEELGLHKAEPEEMMFIQLPGEGN